jgi:excisionase family DNA binding protein
MAKQPAGFHPQEESTAVFARVPPDAARKLDRAAAALRLSKREIVASLLSTLDTQEGELLLGRAEVSRADPRADVLTPRQLAAFLQVDESTVLELAERGELPGRRLGGEWRFARAAVLAWLGG